MLIFGMIMPLIGQGFNVALFGSWAGVAGVGVLAGIDTRRKLNHNGNDNGSSNDNT